MVLGNEYLYYDHFMNPLYKELIFYEIKKYIYKKKFLT
jgi:hypothetical protein